MYNFQGKKYNINMLKKSLPNQKLNLDLTEDLIRKIYKKLKQIR